MFVNSPNTDPSDNRRMLRRFALVATLVAFSASCAPPPPPPASGKLDYSPKPFDFGTVVVATNKTMTMTLTNTASQGDVSIGLVNLDRADRRHFSVSPKRGAVTLTPGQTKTVTFTCNPKAVGPLTARYQPIFVTGDRSNFPATLKCKGTYQLTEGNSLKVTSPGLRSDQSLNFGIVQIGARPTKTLTVTNRTNQQITVTVSWVFRDAALTVNPRPSTRVTIPANGSTNVTVTFAPTNTNTSKALLRIRKAAGDQFTIAVFGKGVRGGG